MLFCTIIIFFLFPNIVLCLFILFYNVKTLQCYYLCYNFVSYFFNIIVLCVTYFFHLVMLVCNVILLFFVMLYHCFVSCVVCLVSCVLCLVSCVLLSRFVILYRCFLRHNIVQCLVISFCHMETLFYR